MSSYDPPPPNPLGPPRRLPPPPPPRGGGGAWGVLFALSFVLNLVLIVGVCGFFGLVLLIGPGTTDTTIPLGERFYGGSETASDKIAIVKIEGLLLEGTLNHVHRQIETAAKDEDVKAVVVRIDSPGGSVTASDDLHRRLTELRDGSPTKNIKGKKHVVASMGSVAASGGYYVAMPASPVFAEKTTMTGSIGIYTALPNVKKLADDYGVKMTYIKRGEVKASGSMFTEMTPQERHVWEDSIDTGYKQFLDIVEAGRPQLKGKVRHEKLLEKLQTSYENDQKEKVAYSRYLADGGVWTADKALQFHLVDKIGTLDDAVEDAKKAAGLGTVKVINYREPMLSLSDLLSGNVKQKSSPLDAASLSSAAAPRLWYLAPGYELSGVLAAADH